MQPAIIVRAERAADVETISRVTRDAFLVHPHSPHTEEHIITALRESGALSVSQVAETGGEVIGHIAFSPVVVADGSQGWYGLGPMAVAPEWQGHGVGQALVRSGLAAIRELGARGCVVLGEPAFYGRFGFRSRESLWFEGVPAEYFMSLPFGETLADGEVTYAPAFYAGSPGERTDGTTPGSVETGE